MITVKRVKNDKGVPLGTLNIGDTFLYDNRVGIIVVRNGHCFPLDLENATEMTGGEYPFAKILPLDTKVVPIQVELTYNFVKTLDNRLNLCYNRDTIKEEIKMKSTGLIRRIDDLGRVVIPKEVRRNAGVREGDPFEIYLAENGDVVLHKYNISNEVARHLENALDVLDYDDPLYEEISKIKKKVEKNS